MGHLGGGGGDCGRGRGRDGGAQDRPVWQGRLRPSLLRGQPPRLQLLEPAEERRESYC